MKKCMFDKNSPLILHRTPRSEIERGIPIVTAGKGVHVSDQEGNKYLDFVAGVTRPVHVRFGREELAQAAYDQMCKMNNIIERARKMGLIIKTMGHALEFAPPLIIQKNEIDETLIIIRECIESEEKEMGL